ncbi:MAG TPA: hypothetical protein VFD58_22725 [Blastocatellia bacterium]|nr:hypothetical protein [Blastocatellia bacterium]
MMEISPPFIVSTEVVFVIESGKVRFIVVVRSEPEPDHKQYSLGISRVELIESSGKRE